VVSGFVPALTLAIGEATNNVWWHPGVVLAAMSLITLLASVQAGRMKVAEAVA